MPLLFWKDQMVTKNVAKLAKNDTSGKSKYRKVLNINKGYIKNFKKRSVVNINSVFHRRSWLSEY